MRRMRTYKSIVIASMILGFFISIQIKTINLENNGMTTSKKGEQLAIELKSLKEKEQELNSEVDEIRKNISKYNDIEDKTNNGLISSELEKYEMLAGYTDVSGKGVEIKIKTNEETLGDDASKNIMYNYDLLLSMINKLNSAQANAITVNGERIVANTYIYLKSDKLYINETAINAPLVIKAIGDPDTLASALKIKYGIVWEIETYYNAKVEIEKKDKIEIRGHSKRIDLKYSITKD